MSDIVRGIINGIINTVLYERKKLAKHCVVVIHEVSSHVQWCTVCQARQQITEGTKNEKFVHKEDCLVEKVMSEA